MRGKTTKYTYEEVKSYFESQGCKLLSKNYINSEHKLEYECCCGNTSTILLNSFKNGNRCKSCAIKKQTLSLEYVKKYFEDHDCELLSENYIKSIDKLDYRCSCGNVSKITFNNFKRGHRCRYCSNKKHRLTLEYVKDFFLKNNCALLSEEYKNNSEKLHYQCSCGHFAYINFSSFKLGVRCKNCSSSKQRHSIEYIKEFLAKNNCTLVSEEYTNINQRIIFLCSCGELDNKTIAGLRKGFVGCKSCGIKVRSGLNSPSCIVDKKTQSAAIKLMIKSNYILRRYLKGDYKNIRQKTIDKIGYDAQTFREYFVNHKNYSLIDPSEICIDHIFPIVAFVKCGITDMSVINFLSNLQPLSISENSRKLNKYDEAEFFSWLDSIGYDRHNKRWTENPKEWRPTNEVSDRNSEELVPPEVYAPRKKTPPIC